MNISRKEFFRQSLLSVAQTICTVKDSLRSEGATVVAEQPAKAIVSSEGERQMLATVSNSLCLAGNCGCFACVERCGCQAISIVPGIGIRIDSSRCTGCGDCEYVCPVLPKAISLV